jgi:hypothetical protein
MGNTNKVAIYARAKAGIGRKAGHQKPYYYRDFHKNCLGKEDS